MPAAPVTSGFAGQQHFACTRCGACCNRPPELELSETAALADQFVFRLMFRLCTLRRTPSAEQRRDREQLAAFHERKRLLSQFSAHRHHGRTMVNGAAVEGTRFLTISAICLPSRDHGCPVLLDDACGIYPRRPLACRTVPFHYSRPEALAGSELQAFVTTAGHRCDTSSDAPVMVEAGQIRAPEVRQARAAAQAVADRDRPWKQAIVRRMGRHGRLPSLRDVEANAAKGVLTTDMCTAWLIAASEGLIGHDVATVLIGNQLAAMDRLLADPKCPAATVQTVLQMRSHYLPC